MLERRNDKMFRKCKSLAPFPISMDDHSRSVRTGASIVPDMRKKERREGERKFEMNDHERRMFGLNFLG